MTTNRLFSITILLVLDVVAAVISSCDKANNNGDNNGFDRSAMLENYADNIIQPNFADLQTEATALQAAVTAFTATPNQQNLSALQTAWKEAFIAYQHVNAFNFGPGETFLGTVTQRLATFPVDTATLEGYIDAADYTLDNLNRDTRGFLGMEYLIFDKGGDDNAVIDRYTTAGDAENRKAYLEAVAEIGRAHV